MLGIYSKIKEKQRKKRILPVSIIGEESRMIVHLKSAMMEEIRNYLELVRDAMMDEVQQAVNNFWAKIRPVLEYQSRSIAALAEALDEMTIKRRRMRRRGVGESTGQWRVEVQLVMGRWLIKHRLGMHETTQTTLDFQMEGVAATAANGASASSSAKWEDAGMRSIRTCRGGNWSGNGPYNGFGRERGSYGRADRASHLGAGQRGGH
uniref:Uncharacterized protein n=1 Tax=Globodera pallida TaxID=36090 RepID=A0A183C702_GLOPA